MNFELTHRAFSFNSIEYDVEKIASHCGCTAKEINPEVPAYTLFSHDSRKATSTIFLLDTIFPYSIPQKYLEPTFDTFNTVHSCSYTKFFATEYIVVSIPWLKGQDNVLEISREDYSEILAEIQRSWKSTEFSKDDAPELSDRSIKLILVKYPSQVVELVIRYYCGSMPCTFRGLTRLDGTKTYSLEELIDLEAGSFELFLDGIEIPIVEEIEDEVFIFYEDNFIEYREQILNELKGEEHVAIDVG